ncbi:GerMN domain-containing protein [Desertibacillus haloalkaliphilus]|uniref:GerMN domain-containing protein n=1 Tax=Desertibacillus haloalkaliphilus TaxID=1328930 RepID=UPI001C274033|nr:GerMN domain-containing protein [Desertibacillus haloalkaliphilus]MBU8908382.1 GerMN domain-containing protein [Desertibacillus haloalkaliphilus]
MKQKHLMLLLTISLVFIIAACGNNETIDSDDTNDGIDTDQNEELIDSEIDSEEVNQQTGADGQEEEDANAEEAKTHPVTLYFTDQQQMEIYRVEESIEATDDELFKATLETWIAGPTHNELSYLIPSNVTVQSVEEIEGVAHVSFSNEILEANLGSGGEGMLLTQIALIMEQFGFSETQVLIDGEHREEFLGHMTISEPIPADDPENYDWIE